MRLRMQSSFETGILLVQRPLSVLVLLVFAASTSFYFSLFFFLLIFFFFAASWMMTASSAFEDDGEAKQKSIITEVGITRLKRPRFFLIEK